MVNIQWNIMSSEGFEVAARVSQDGKLIWFRIPGRFPVMPREFTLPLADFMTLASAAKGVSESLTQRDETHKEQTGAAVVAAIPSAGGGGTSE